MQHAMLAARTIATASCTPSERATVLGYIGASYGIGFAVGPAVGGWLSSISLTATAWAAAGVSVVALVVVQLGLPDGRTQGCNGCNNPVLGVKIKICSNKLESLHVCCDRSQQCRLHCLSRRT